jgi:hypothetical protein
MALLIPESKLSKKRFCMLDFLFRYSPIGFGDIAHKQEDGTKEFLAHITKTCATQPQDAGQATIKQMSKDQAKQQAGETRNQKTQTTSDQFAHEHQCFSCLAAVAGCQFGA